MVNLGDYAPIGLMFILATGLALLVVGISILFGPRKRANDSRKVAPYESGMRAIGPGQRRLPVRFYLVAVLFLLFDIEIVFFYPWAVAFRELGWGGFVAMLSFVGILLIGLVWVWKKGALEWETMDKQ
jgi:NADH-quinone oxidoreductase subunit A